MPWTYIDNSSLMIIEVTFAGEITGADLREATSELIAYKKVNGRNKFLIDTAEMVFAASMSDLFDLPTKQYREEGVDFQDRVAVVLSSSTREREAAEFYETICRSCGWQVRTFSERRHAIDWLMNTAKPIH